MAFGYFGNEQYNLGPGSELIFAEIPSSGLLAHWDNSLASMPLDGSAWNDISGNSRDFTQATVAARPTHVASGINSLPTFQFTGSGGGGGNEFFTNTTSGFLGLSGLTELTFVWVVQFNSFSASNDQIPVVLGFNATTTHSVQCNVEPTPKLQTKSAVGSVHDAFNLSASTPYIVIMACKIDTTLPGSSNKECTRGNGGLPIACGATASTSYANDTYSFIAAESVSGSVYTKDDYMSEMLLYNRLLTINEINDVQEVLGDKYNITATDWIDYET